MSCSQFFIDPIYLSRYGLSLHTAVQYFLHEANPFRSNNITTNDLLATATGANDSPPTPEQVQATLNNEVGEQYTAEEVQFENEENYQALPKFVYVIKHWMRHSPEQKDITLLGVYYIVDGQIFRSPTLSDVLTTRLSRAVTEIVAGLDEKEWEMMGGTSVKELDNIKKRQEEAEELESRMEDEDEDEDEEFAAAHKPKVLEESKVMSNKNDIFERLEKRFLQ